MSTNDYCNNVSINSQENVSNKGFQFLDELFKSNGWHLVKNELNYICYTRKGFETDIFEIKIDRNIIRVSVPVKGSPFQYVTSFKDYFNASEYIEKRFHDFVGINTEILG